MQSSVRSRVGTWYREGKEIVGGLATCALVIQGRSTFYLPDLFPEFFPEGTLVEATGESRALQVLNTVPLNVMSRFWGMLVAAVFLPMWLHQIGIRMVILLFGVATHEIEKPLHEYRTAQEFFHRKLIKGARRIDPHSDLVSPCDAEVLQAGPVTSLENIVPVKNRSMSLQQLFQPSVKFPATPDGCRRWYVLFHLRPKDYHRFHCPADATVSETVHVPGCLFPVTQAALKHIPSLFCTNERVCINGTWKHGLFCMAPVGASCVGKIHLTFDYSIRTNVRNPPLATRRKTYEGDARPALVKGEELGHFDWGSAIVLMLDLPENQKITLRPGDNVRVGQQIAFEFASE